MNLTFSEFNERIGFGHNTNDEEWRRDVGYRPSDKDGGFKRWLELTGNSEDDCFLEFRRVVYGDNLQIKEVPKQHELLLIEVDR